MKRLKFLIFVVLWASVVHSQSSKKNVVLIVIDDLGWADLGCYGSTFYETPNLDKLAKEGYKFTNAYSASPVCSPTRASIMTGIYPSTLKNTDWFGAVQPEEAQRDKKWSKKQLLPAAYNPNLELDNYTVAEAFKAKGYSTFIAGKWHLGEEESHWPEFQGFDINKGGHLKGNPGNYFSPYKNPRLTDGPTGEYLGDRLTDELLSFLDAQAGKPFFAYFPMYEVHTPLQSKKEIIAKYEAKRIRLGLTDEFLTRPDGGKTRTIQSHTTYAAMVEMMDFCVGRIMDKLKASGLDKNTIVLFTSDNGGLSTAEGAPTSNLPLKAGKGWVNEGGIRVPFIIRLPNEIAGKEIATPVISNDIFPTLLDLASMKNKQTKKIDGKSLCGVLKGKSLKRDLYWHYPHYGNQGSAPAAAIRSGCMKLIHHFEDDKVELFNLCDDIGEQKDLASTQPEIKAKMLAKLKKWQADTNVNFPTQNPFVSTK